SDRPDGRCWYTTPLDWYTTKVGIHFCDCIGLTEPAVFMPTADSQLEFDDLRPEGSGEGARGEFWLKGDVVTCACPDCGSPMTIRTWLMAADCWVCGSNVVLTEEQQREVQRLIEAQAQKAAPAVET